MKNFIVIILAFVYITTSSGAVLYMHYCMGKITGWGLSQGNSKTCQKCGMLESVKKDTGCCSDKYKVFKTDADQKKNEAPLLHIQLINGDLTDAFILLPAVQFPTTTEQSPVSNAQTHGNSIPLYIRNCVFLI